MIYHSGLLKTVAFLEHKAKKPGEYSALIADINQQFQGLNLPMPTRAVVAARGPQQVGRGEISQTRSDRVAARRNECDSRASRRVVRDAAKPVDRRDTDHVWIG